MVGVNHESKLTVFDTQDFFYLKNPPLLAFLIDILLVKFPVHYHHPNPMSILACLLAPSVCSAPAPESKSV